MTLISNKNSVSSIFLALLALVFSIFGIEGFRINGGINGIFWPYMQSMFSVNANSDNMSIIRETPAFPITDNNLIILFLFASVALAVVSIVLGFKAKKSGESSLLYAGPIVLSVLIILSVTPHLSYLKLS